MFDGTSETVKFLNGPRNVGPWPGTGSGPGVSSKPGGSMISAPGARHWAAAVGIASDICVTSAVVVVVQIAPQNHAR
jgi:hypothetical protein